MMIGFESIFPIVLMFYITVGLFSSYAIDWMERFVRKDSQSSYLSSFMAYAVGGLLVVLLMELIFFSKFEIPFAALLVFGVAPGLVFYHVDLILLKFVPILAKIAQK
nr:hypothetical protein [Brevibacillus laterosporus]